MTSYKNNTFYLVVRGITRKDMGQFFCVADNGIGNEVSQPAYLVVKRKYFIIVNIFNNFVNLYRILGLVYDLLVFFKY